MKLWRNDFSNCSCLRLSDPPSNFLSSFTFSVVEVSDFILYKYEPIICQFGVIGATRPFSLFRTNLHVLGEMSKEHGKIKRYTDRNGTARRSRSRIKIIYTTFTRPPARHRPPSHDSIFHAISRKWPTVARPHRLIGCFMQELIQNPRGEPPRFWRGCATVRFCPNPSCDFPLPKRCEMFPTSWIYLKFTLPRGNVGAIWTRWYKTLCWEDTFVTLENYWHLAQVRDP